MNLPTATLLVSCPDQKGIDLVVLPKYMQILTPKIVENFSQIINIHHSFLPAFAGPIPIKERTNAGLKLSVQPPIM